MFIWGPRQKCIDQKENKKKVTHATTHKTKKNASNHNFDTGGNRETGSSLIKNDYASCVLCFLLFESFLFPSVCVSKIDVGSPPWLKLTLPNRIRRFPTTLIRPRRPSGSSRSTTFSERKGPERVQQLLTALEQAAIRNGVELPFTATTPYVNTIPHEKQPRYPGKRELERRIKSFIRWNAMAMVVRANRDFNGIGGHISTYASSANLYEVAMNHFFRGRGESGYDGDQIYFQGHASPGMYARAFLEGRLTEANLVNFRRELQSGGGLSSYPHPWLMPEFWEFPTVSMGLGPIMAIYQARFNRYLTDRGILDCSKKHVWAFLGDGECDEPESLGAITLASREKLDNLIFVINCNLQRLDGPVRGNGKIIQELEGAFRGAGWNVIKVVWGSDWDPLLDLDEAGVLQQRMMEVPDGQYQKYVVSSGDYIREDFFGKYPETAEMVKSYSDEKLQKMKRGGHDPEKVYAAYKAAFECEGKPTVILAKTIKGYGLGEGGEGRNMTHNQKKLNEDELREFRTRFGIPISDERVAEAPFYRPPEESPEMNYLRERRKALGGSVPSRSVKPITMEVPRIADYAKTMEKLVSKGPGKEMSTTMGYVRLLGDLLRDKKIGKYIVPIVPGRIAHVRYGRSVPPGRHLLARRPALRTGRFRSASVLQGSERRPAVRGRYHRSWFDVVVRRCRYGVFIAWREHDSHVHLLFDVRLPADRRSDLGSGRRSCEGLHPRWHVRPHDAQRRRSAASGRPQPPQRDRVPDGSCLRSGLRL